MGLFRPEVPDDPSYPARERCCPLGRSVACLAGLNSAMAHRLADGRSREAYPIPHVTL
jgi:hypothetical protein